MEARRALHAWRPTRKRNVWGFRSAGVAREFVTFVTEVLRFTSVFSPDLSGRGQQDGTRIQRGTVRLAALPQE